MPLSVLPENFRQQNCWKNNFDIFLIRFIIKRN